MSGATGSIARVTEDQLTLVDSALMYISEARERAESTARELRAASADPDLVAAVEDADRELLALHKRLMDAAYFPAQSSQLRLSA